MPMQHSFEYPIIVHSDGHEINTGYEIPVRVTIEADDTIGCLEWYVSHVEIFGRVDGQKRERYHDIGRKHELFGKIAEYARKYCDEALTSLWRGYLEDRPALRRAIMAAD
jgi:hypothetical protein